jgi:hypothetical protein
MSTAAQFSFPHCERVLLPTGTVRTSADLFWIHSHSAGRESSLGVRFLHWRKRLTKARSWEMLDFELNAYNHHLPELQRTFEAGLTGLAWDIAIQAPSCAPYAQQFATLAPKVRADSPFAIFEYNCQKGTRRDSAEGASVDELATAMFTRGPISSLDKMRQVLVVDESYADGKTVAAVIRKLWANGLSQDASILIAVVLRIHPTRQNTA